MMSRTKKFILIFSLAYYFVVGMLFLLQISKMPWFFIWLILMHGGIVVLALLKRSYQDLDILSYFKRAYLSLLLFIPILIYKIIVAIFSLEENEAVVTYVSLFFILICIGMGIYNIIKLKNMFNS